MTDTHFFVLTVQNSSKGIVGTWTGTFTPQPGWSRKDAYKWLIAEHDKARPQLAGGVVLFIDISRNEI